MRTDSIRLSEEFIKPTYGFIKDKYGEDYLGYVKVSKKLKMSKMPTKPFVQLVLTGPQKVSSLIYQMMNINCIK